MHETVPKSSKKIQNEKAGDLRNSFTPEKVHMTPPEKILLEMSPGITNQIDTSMYLFQYMYQS